MKLVFHRQIPDNLFFDQVIYRVIQSFFMNAFCIKAFHKLNYFLSAFKDFELFTLIHNVISVAHIYAMGLS